MDKRLIKKGDFIKVCDVSECLTFSNGETITFNKEKIIGKAYKVLRIESYEFGGRLDDKIHVALLGDIKTDEYIIYATELKAKKLTDKEVLARLI
ncbi:MAG: hypothetical protein IMZ52_02365 [Actinobacteria bacterium]|nr:hypothetical protein [Actinomycetota bacterium]MBE3114867.1 hypothetical protein [Actinomycetota bacterium]